MILWLQDKVEVIEHHNTFVHSVYTQFQLPSIIRLKKYVRIQRCQKIRFSRENVYLRDQYQCQYCAETFQAKSLTLDHVHPASQGGEKSWLNIVTACRSCNQKKGNRTPKQAHMPLLRKPFEPKWLPSAPFQFKPTRTPESWATFLAQVT